MRYFLDECQKMERDIHESKIGSNDRVLVEKATEGGFVGHTADFCEALIKTNTIYTEGDLVDVRIAEYADGKLICQVR